MSDDESRTGNQRTKGSHEKGRAQRRSDFERYQAVLLFLEGYQKKEIARIIGRCPHSVGHYVQAYENGGVDGLLQRGVSTGKPSRLTPEQKQILLKTVAYKTPDDVGFFCTLFAGSAVYRTKMEKNLHTARGIQASSFTGIKLYKTDLYASKSRSSEAEYVCPGDLSLSKKT
jgi:transposase